MADDPRDRPEPGGDRAEPGGDRAEPGGDRADWELLESSGDLDTSTRRALKDLERIAAFSRELQRSEVPRDEAPRDDAPGKSGAAPERWGHLMLLERVGAGVQGEVWRAWDATLQRQVALKFLQSEGAASDQAPSSDLVSEARALARVRHPGVVSVYGIAQHDGRTGMWMEWIEGLTLARDIERRGALPAREVAHIGFELCAALEALEGAGVVHRDVKPANIVLETGRRVVLTDFGLGWRPALEEARGRPSGTPYFMAPELLRGGEPGPRTDLYALGVTLWWALAGRSPFRASTLAELRTEAVRGPSTPLRAARQGLPEPLVDAIEWAMKPDESERPRSAAQLKERLALAFPGEAAGASAPAGTWLTRAFTGPGAWWRIGVVVLALAGLSWWAAARIRAGGEGEAGRWTARQVPMPPEVQGNSDYSLSPDGTKIAYVSGSGSALSVFSIDTNDARIVDHLAPGEGTYASVGWASDGSKLVASHCDAAREGTEVLVDPITGRREVLARIGSVGADELTDMRAALSPDGRFVATRSDYSPDAGTFRTLRVLDVRSGTVRTLARGGADEFIGPPAWDPSGTRLGYLLERRKPFYARIETCDLRGTRSIVVEDSTGSLLSDTADYRTLSWLSADRLLYAVRRGGDQAGWWMVPVDRSGRSSGRARLVYSLAGATVHSPSMSRSGVIAFTGERNLRRLTLIGTDGRPRYPSLDAGVELAGLRFPTWSPDGTSLFVRSDANPLRPAIGRIALSTGRFEEIAPAAPHDRPLCPTPDGRELLCTMNSQLVAVPLLGGAPRVLAGSFRGLILYAPRADRWAAVERTGGDLVFRDFTPSAGLGAVRFPYPVPHLDELLVPTVDLSPDGSQIVVLRGDTSGFDVLDAGTGRVLRQIPKPAGSLPQDIRWSPDGRTFYATGMGGPATFWVARLGAKGLEHLVRKSDDLWTGEPAISPDGATLAVTSLRFTDELWIIQRR